MAGTALISPHHPTQKILDSVEYARAGEAIFVGLKIQRLVDAVWVLDWRVKRLAFGYVDERRAVHLNLFFGVSSGQRGGGRFCFAAKVVTMGNLALGGYLHNAYLFGPLLHLEVVDVVDSGTALDGLHLFEVVLFEVIAHN